MGTYSKDPLEIREVNREHRPTHGDFATPNRPGAIRAFIDRVIPASADEATAITHASTMAACRQMTDAAIRAVYDLQAFVRMKRPLNSNEKADHTVVTVADKELNEMLRNALEPLGIPFMGEESEHLLHIIQDGTYLAVDPIDGTGNFVKMFNGDFDSPALDHVTLISLVRDGSPVIGICANHYTGELDVAVNDRDLRLERHATLDELPGLSFAGHTGRSRVAAAGSRRALILGSKAKDPVNEKYAREAKVVQIGGIGFRIISLCNPALDDGLVFHTQAAGLWDLAAPHVFASINGVRIHDGDGNALDFTRQAYFPGNGAMALKGDSLGYRPWASNPRIPGS